MQLCHLIYQTVSELASLDFFQVLPELMKLLAQLIVQLPEVGQNMVLNELYSQVADSDDVTRKPTLVSWLQSLSYLCVQANKGCINPKRQEKEGNIANIWTTDPPNHTSINARL